jgi:L-ribulose-5-phosphate 3-epimerase
LSGLSGEKAIVRKIGIMQGRLLPPVDDHIQAFPGQRWREEFALAQECGLGMIEWIFEGNDWKSNPIISNPVAIQQETEKHGTDVVSLIADFFMDFPLIRASKNEQSERMIVLSDLIENAHEIGVKFVNIPFVDNSEIKTDDEANQVADLILQVLPKIESYNMQVGLETSLAPERFSHLLKLIDHPQIRVNYDIGNSASLEYDPQKEMSAYGRNIATLHVKDRVKGGGTVPLGDGDADFTTVFSCLGEIDYDGPIVIQAARDGNEIAAAKRYVKFVQNYLEKYFP